MNFFYSNTFPHISSEDTTREPVRLGQRGPGVTETQTSTLAKGHKISLLFGVWGELLMHLPGFLNAPGMSLSAEIRDSLRNFRVAYLFFPFCFCSKETAVNYYSATDFLSLD